MDLRKLTIDRLNELIAINDRKMKMPHNQGKYMNDLIRVRTKLIGALEWKFKNE